VNGRYLILLTILLTIFLSTAFVGCAPIEYSVVIVQASQAISEAKVAGAECTQAQLDGLSPVTMNNIQPSSGTELASTEKKADKKPAFGALEGVPMCNAPYEYYRAVEYLDKAREEVGYSDYEAALDFARKSRESAKKAMEISQKLDMERGRGL
jgi:hypothetical protein